MELTAPCPKMTSFYRTRDGVSIQHRIFVLNKHKKHHHPYKTNNINTTLTLTLTLTLTTHSPSKLPIQIQLPLHRPKYNKPTRPINPPKNKPTTTTTSDILHLMDSLNLPISKDIYISLIKECTETRNLIEAIQLHTHINLSSFRHDMALINRLLIMYVSCGYIKNARQLFDKMPVKDLNSCAAMIFGYVQDEKYEEAIDLFIKMQYQYQYYKDKGIVKFPVSWIVVCILEACVCAMNLECGRQIHGWVMKLGYLKDLFVSSSLVNFYGKLGCLEGAAFVFDQITWRNTVVWTANIVNNCKEERFDEVFNLFNEMGREGVKKNSFTFSSVLKACGKMRDGGYCGRQVHSNAIKLGVNFKSYVQCGLVDMYGKLGLVKDARRVFEMEGVKRNAACWNAMLNGYVQNGFCIEAVKVLYEMKAAGLEPQESLVNEVRLVCGCTNLENKI